MTQTNIGTSGKTGSFNPVISKKSWDRCENSYQFYLNTNSQPRDTLQQNRLTVREKSNASQALSKHCPVFIPRKDNLLCIVLMQWSIFMTQTFAAK